MRNIITAIILVATAAAANAYTPAELDKATSLAVLSVKCEERGFATGASVLHVAIALTKGRGGLDSAMKAAKAMENVDDATVASWDRVYEIVMDGAFTRGGEDELAFLCGTDLHEEARKFMSRRK